jgi:ABC-type phosphate/phosphonate transport system ATPase subunit
MSEEDSLARALVARPEPWLIDEPLSALDPSRAAQALKTLRAAARDSSSSLVCTLHHVEMVLKHFPRILGLREGSLMFDLSAILFSFTEPHMREFCADSARFTNVNVATINDTALTTVRQRFA